MNPRRIVVDIVRNIVAVRTLYLASEAIGYGHVPRLAAVEQRQVPNRWDVGKPVVVQGGVDDVVSAGGVPEI
ncbi:hypothetical protein ACFX1W_039585 [Malus domestica]